MKKESFNRHEARSYIWNLTFELGDMELKLLLDLSRRLRFGQNNYGMLYPKKKNWAKEFYEEMLDGIVYAGCQIIEENSKLRTPKPARGSSPKRKAKASLRRTRKNDAGSNR